MFLFFNKMEKIKFTKFEMFKFDDDYDDGYDGVFFSSSDKENVYSIDEETKSLQVANSGKYILKFPEDFFNKEQKRIMKIKISKKEELVADPGFFLYYSRIQRN